MVQFEMTATAGNLESNPLETAVMLDSFEGVLKWIFFSIVAIVIAIIYIKKKNANSDGNKHS